MRLTLKQLRALIQEGLGPYVRNALSPSSSNREAIGSLKKLPIELGDPVEVRYEEPNEKTTPDETWQTSLKLDPNVNDWNVGPRRTGARG